MSSKMDVLKRDKFIEKLITLVDTISAAKRGCCFAINGAWGSGKSFVLERFEEKLSMLQLEETATDKYFVFHYDCWKYDYYDEPAIAIIAAMLDVTDKELHFLTSDTRDMVKKAAWETTKETLKTVASELCKNKIGIDLVEVITETAEKYEEEIEDNFDSLYGFRRALVEMQNGIKEISENKTVVIVVDELDRCLPEYSIKVLERLHHIFVDLENVIVIISMDKEQLEHSIRGIYGNIEVDAYLRKFISFKVNLDKGIPGNFFNKYDTYTSMFEFHDEEKREIETFLTNIMYDIDVRTQEHIFNKAEIIHRIITNNPIQDCSIMTFEILFLTARVILNSKNVRSIVYSDNYSGSDNKVTRLHRLVQEAKNKMNIVGGNTTYYIRDKWMDKTIFWIANIYDSYNAGQSLMYYYVLPNEDLLDIIRKFTELIDIIDSN